MTAAAGFLFWEMLKIGTAIAMLLIASRVVPQLSWPALLLTMVVVHEGELVRAAVARALRNF